MYILKLPRRQYITCLVDLWHGFSTSIAVCFLMWDNPKVIIIQVELVQNSSFSLAYPKLTYMTFVRNSALLIHTYVFLTMCEMKRTVRGYIKFHDHTSLPLPKVWNLVVCLKFVTQTTFITIHTKMKVLTWCIFWSYHKDNIQVVTYIYP